jgi:hypothetical protein
MPPRRGKTSERELRQLLRESGYGLRGDYMNLIDKAVRHQWTVSQVVQRLVNTKAFRHEFPGLIERNGSIANLFTDRQGQPVSLSSLGSAIGNYRNYEDKFNSLARDYNFKFSKNMMLNVIRSQTSPQEFQARLAVIRTVDTTPGLHDFFAEALKANGVRGVNTQREIYRLAAGTSNRRFEDIYETARISAAGLGTPQQAAQIARQVGQPGEAIDIGKLVSEVRQNLSYIGPELQQSGISNADLLKFFSDPEGNPDLAGRINQIIAGRQSVGAARVPGAQLRQGAAGGPTTYAPEGAAAY